MFYHTSTITPTHSNEWRTNGGFRLNPLHSFLILSAQEQSREYNRWTNLVDDHSRVKIHSIFDIFDLSKFDVVDTSSIHSSPIRSFTLQYIKYVDDFDELYAFICYWPARICRNTTG